MGNTYLCSRLCHVGEATLQRLHKIHKIITAHIREKIYNLLVCHGLFPEEQKLWHMGTKEAGVLLHIDRHII